jgi:glutamate synthase domain-containing protein 2
MSSNNYTSQNDLLLNNLMEFYKNNDNLDKMLKIITGESKISLRIVDWFATNYAKKYYTLYSFEDTHGITRRFKVYVDYKLKLKAYSKRRFDPFCRWERISIPYKNGTFIETTIGQLNFFKWTLENKVINYIEDNYETIEKDMNTRNSTSKRKEVSVDNNTASNNTKTRKKREELSVSATKSIKKEKVEIVVNFN